MSFFLFEEKGVRRVRHQEDFNGIVLFSRNYKDKDKLVKIFTETYGKKMFFVKGANRKNNPLTAALQPFTKACFIGDIKSEGLSFLNTVKEITPYEKIQTDIFISAYATYILNLVDVAIEDGIYDPALYGFTLEALVLLNKEVDPEIVTNIFEVQLLQRFGITINWKSCAICGNKQGKFDYSYANNGLLCEKHWHMDERRAHFNPRGLHFIRLFSQIKYDQLNTIDLQSETKDQIRIILDDLYQEYVGIFLKSKKFIDEMKSWENMLKKD